MSARGLLLLSSLLLPTLPARGQDEPRPSPSAEVAWIASRMAADGGAELAYVATNTSVNVIRGHAWIISAWTADLPDYQAEYFVLSWIDGKLTGELLVGAGDTRVLETEALQEYLRRVQLDYAPLEAAFRRYYTDPARAPPGGG